MTDIKVVNLQHKLAQFTEQWTPKIVGQVNDTHVKIAKVQGEFDWHHHEHEDEMFLVVSGTLTILLPDGELTVNPGEFTIIPRGVEHKPVADEECAILMIEPAGTINTGNLVEHDKTVADPERI